MDNDNPNDNSHNEINRILNDKGMSIISDELCSVLMVKLPPEIKKTFEHSCDLFNAKLGIFRQNNLILFEKINGDVEEKICAIYYHYENAVMLQAIIDDYTKKIMNRANVLELNNCGISMPTQKLKFEYEAFILQSRACLDYFCGSIAFAFGFSVIKLDKLEKQLTQVCHKNDKAKTILKKIHEDGEFYNRLHELLISKTKNANFMSGFSDRDKIAHQGKLSLAEYSVSFSQKGGNVFPLSRVESGKSAFDASKLTTLMQQFMFRFFKFISEIYLILLE